MDLTETKAKIEARMLSGEPFTYADMAAWAVYHFGINEVRQRLVDRAIQRLRKAGKIDKQRKGNTFEWRATEPY